MRSRTFLHVSLGILALATAYHLGARSASAQLGQSVSGFSFDASNAYVMTGNGDVYRRFMDGQTTSGGLVYIGNFWGGPTPTQQESFGAVKARYR